VDSLSGEGQAALERFLDRRTHGGVGDLRVLAASSRPLGVMSLEGTFRPDLYYRLAIVTLRIPPLRERLEDVGDLARAFLVRARRDGLPEKGIDASAIELLKTHTWPGNVRELENLLHRAAALRPEPLISAREIAQEMISLRQESAQTPAGGETFEDVIKPHLSAMLAGAGSGGEPFGVYDRVLHAIERPLIELALQGTRGNQIKAAAILGINRNTLRKKIQVLAIRTGSDD